MQLKKRVIRVSGKNYFLIGEDEQKEKYWLEEPEFSFERSWEFGYIKSFRKGFLDIKSNTPADFFVTWFEEWTLERPQLVKTTFSKRKGWELAELFKRVYIFKDIAEYHYIGGANIANKCKTPSFADKKEWLKINREIISTFIEGILNILAPKDELNIYEWKDQIEDIRL